ncbi:hypothetical protein Ahy_A08g040133 [Arachis hypogaea]|uniref:Protein kinase domain-containing protein n=1 Tax=Arachis hypogaea TaxID=3818 RepID=A0A445BYC1_ARAHY|nr:hypothetical protein Ahy_A08g040133 [Arachis hypogaea]
MVLFHNYCHVDIKLTLNVLKCQTILEENIRLAYALSNMNVKISDFSLVKTFAADQTKANTKRVMMGTHQLIK